MDPTTAWAGVAGTELEAAAMQPVCQALYWCTYRAVDCFAYGAASLKGLMGQVVSQFARQRVQQAVAVLHATASSSSHPSSHKRQPVGVAS